MKTIKYKWFCFLLLAGACLLLPHMPRVAKGDRPERVGNGSVAVKLRPQQTNMWCWAASGEMVMETLGKDVAQCIQANNRFGHTDCCNSPTPSPCIQGGWPEFGKYGFSSKVTDNAALTWSQIVDQIGNKKKPFAFSWHWNSGGGHMMVLSAYSQSGGKNYVTIDNPWPPNVGEVQVLTYEAYVSGPGYTHWNDYYDVTRVATGKEKENVEQKSSSAGSEGGEKSSGAASSEKAEAKDKKAAVKESRGAAQNALKDLSKIEAVKNLFPPGTLDKAALAVHPFPVVMVSLGDLRKAEPEGDTKKLLDGGCNTVIYPITSGDSVVGSMTVQHKEKKWVVASYNGGTLAKLLEQSRRTYAEQNKADSSSSYAVSIPALNLYFVAFPGRDMLRLVPILDEPSLKLKKGEAVKVDDIMPKLIEVAKKHNGLPG